MVLTAWWNSIRREAELWSAAPPIRELLQGMWAGLLVLSRTYQPSTQTYGNLYSNLLDYVVSAALLFYLLTISGVFRLRRLRPEVERPYRAFGYPVIPALYLMAASVILVVLLIYRPSTTLPGFVIVLLGVPVYYGLRRASGRAEDAKLSNRAASPPG